MEERSKQQIERIYRPWILCDACGSYYADWEVEGKNLCAVCVEKVKLKQSKKGENDDQY